MVCEIGLLCVRSPHGRGGGCRKEKTFFCCSRFQKTFVQPQVQVSCIVFAQSNPTSNINMQVAPLNLPRRNSLTSQLRHLVTVGGEVISSPVSSPRLQGAWIETDPSIVVACPTCHKPVILAGDGGYCSLKCHLKTAASRSQNNTPASSPRSRETYSM
jgi:hypothetical protein